MDGRKVLAEGTPSRADGYHARDPGTRGADAPKLGPDVIGGSDGPHDLMGHHDAAVEALEHLKKCEFHDQAFIGHEKIGHWLILRTWRSPDESIEVDGSGPRHLLRTGPHHWARRSRPAWMMHSPFTDGARQIDRGNTGDNRAQVPPSMHLGIVGGTLWLLVTVDRELHGIGASCLSSQPQPAS